MKFDKKNLKLAAKKQLTSSVEKKEFWFRFFKPNAEAVREKGFSSFDEL